MRQQPCEISPLFVQLASFFVALLLISNVVAGKLISVFGQVLPAAVVLFPVAYILGDVLTEVYGFRHARLVIWAGFACNLLMAVVCVVVVALPYPQFWRGQEAYATVLGMTPRLVAASLVAYAAGAFSNSIVLSKMKVLTRGRWLFARTIGSTIVGEGVDTAIFITGAFYGLVPLQVLLQMVALQYSVKVFYEILATPVTYPVVAWVKKKEGLDAYDRGINYNPFSMGI